MNATLRRWSSALSHEAAAQQSPLEMCWSVQERLGFSCKTERIWGVDGFSVFLVVLVVANLLPESNSIYSSASTSAGPAVPGPAALPAVQSWHPAGDLQEQQGQWWALRYKASVSL